MSNYKLSEETTEVNLTQLKPYEQLYVRYEKLRQHCIIMKLWKVSLSCK